MTLTEMHIMFRQFAQQMGMQNVRAILPEQIDLLINASISDVVNRIIAENIGATSNGIIDNSKLGQINALRTIYKVFEVTLTGTNNYFIFSEEDYLSGLLKDVNAQADIFQHEIVNSGFSGLNPLYWVDFKLRYTKASVGMTDNSLGEKSTEQPFNTNFYPVRLVEDSYLENALNDFILKPSFDSPILNIVGNCFYLYIGECNKQGNEFFVKGTKLIPYKFRMSYIDTPRKVKYSLDEGVPNTETEFPAYLHNDIVKHAVELWQLSVQGNMRTEQNRMNNPQRGQVRNNNRSETT